MVDSLEWALPSKLPPITPATAAQPNIKEIFADKYNNLHKYKYKQKYKYKKTTKNTNIKWALAAI